MGLFDALKGEVRRNFIARPDAAKNDIIYKHPDTNIRKGTDLTVAADEVAVFFRDGKVAGTIQPGRVELQSENVPFLGMLVDYATGGNLYVTELYFVNTREITGLRFGGPIGDQMDPQTGLAVQTMVHGDFSLRVVDPQKLIIGLAGMKRSTNDEVTDWFKRQMMKAIKDDIAELIVKHNWPLLKVTSGAFTEEIEEEVLKGVVRHVEPYGVQIARIGDFHIAIKDEDADTLKKFAKDVAYSRMAGGYQQYAAGQAMMNPNSGAGGAMAMGAGLGAGMGMGQVMAHQMAQPQQTTYPPGMGGAPAPVAAPAQAAAQVKCPKCFALGTGKFCAECGGPLPAAAPAKKFCANCGNELAATAKFCANCGTPAAG
jgi:membrane protease subunit (stomatin/prohibitin family)